MKNAAIALAILCLALVVYNQFRRDHHTAQASTVSTRTPLDELHAAYIDGVRHTANPTDDTIRIQDTLETYPYFESYNWDVVTDEQRRTIVRFTGYMKDVRLSNCRVGHGAGGDNVYPCTMGGTVAIYFNVLPDDIHFRTGDMSHDAKVLVNGNTVITSGTDPAYIWSHITHRQLLLDVRGPISSTGDNLVLFNATL